MRPERDLPQNRDLTVGYLCEACRFPPCAGGCGTPRPVGGTGNSMIYDVSAMPVWTCGACQLEHCIPPCNAGCGLLQPYKNQEEK